MKITINSNRLQGILMAAVAAVALQAQANIIGVGTRAALGANDVLDWGQLGLSYDAVNSPSIVHSAGGIAMVITSDYLERRDQGDGWAGNFSDGARLLWNGGSGSAISIEFEQGLYGVGGGAQVASENYGAFTGMISAFDDVGVLLGSYEFTGQSTSTGDGSARFAGLLSAAGEIHRITITAWDDDTHTVSFAIGQLDLLTRPPGSAEPVPEAGTTAALLGMALLGLGMLRRKLAA